MTEKLATSISEAELASQIEPLLASIGLELVGREIAIGAYRLDAIARTASGDPVVIELKTKAGIESLSQLLLYPNAVRKAAIASRKSCVDIKSMLITTFLGLNLTEILESLSLEQRIQVRVCVGVYPDSLILVRPGDIRAQEQVWDQSTIGKSDLSFLEALN